MEVNMGAMLSIISKKTYESLSPTKMFNELFFVNTFFVQFCI